jgi:hypothetical protein
LLTGDNSLTVPSNIRIASDFLGRIKLDEEDKKALLVAVNTLITSPDAHELYEQLCSVAYIATRAPVKLADKAEPLNPLLALRVADQPAFDRVIELIEARREALGYDHLVKPAERGYDKTRYMRDFMDQKRERQRLAAKIENMLRPERDQLIGNARLDFMRRQSARWKELRDEKLERARAAAGGTLSAEARKRILDQFWEAVDGDLAQRMEAAKRTQLSPTKSRVGIDDMAALMEALELPSR